MTVSVTRALGVPIWASGLCFGLCAFVTVTIFQEFVRGARVRREATGTDLFTALIGLFARSRRRYGGYVIHLGIVLAFLGFAGNGFQREQEVTLQPSQQTDVKPYTVRYDKLSVTDDGQKQMVTAHMTVLRNGQPFDQMFPARWFFRDHEQEPTTEVALRRTIAEDLYLVLAGYDPSTESAQFKIIINPLVNWIWLGVGVILIGTIIALLPERTFAFATSKVPEGAVTTSVLVLALVLGSAASARAQHNESSLAVVAPTQSPVEKDLRSSIICMCGDCGRKRVGECTVPGRRRRARRDLGARQRRQDARRSHSVFRGEVRQPGTARRANRQGLQPIGLVLSVRRRAGRHCGRRWRRVSLVAPRTSARDAGAVAGRGFDGPSTATRR